MSLLHVLSDPAGWLAQQKVGIYNRGKSSLMVSRSKSGPFLIFSFTINLCTVFLKFLSCKVCVQLKIVGLAGFVCKQSQFGACKVVLQQKSVIQCVVDHSNTVMLFVIPHSYCFKKYVFSSTTSCWFLQFQTHL